MKRIRIVWLLLFALCLGSAGYYGYHAAEEIGEYQEGEDTYRDLRQYAADLKEASTEPPRADFGKLSQINPRVIGWIFGAGGEISYPVVQGEDNEYYLNHLFNGEVNSSGSIFLDVRCEGDFSGFHSILYGHHMKNGAMFGRLNQYESQSYYEATRAFF